MRVLGVDFGLRRLGIAVSDEGEAIATPLRALSVGSGLPVRLEDESLSTREAEERASSSGRPARGRDLHAQAAAVILQRWLDRPSRGARSRP